MEELSFDDLLGLANWDFEGFMQSSQEEVINGSKEDLESYLIKGEKIITLLKEKTKRKNFLKAPFMDCVNFNLYSNKNESEKEEYLMSCIRDKMIRPALDECMGAENLVTCFDSFTDLFMEFKERFTCKGLSTGEYPERVMHSFFRRKPGYYRTMEVSVINSGDKEPTLTYSPLGSKAQLTRKQSGSGYSLRGYGKYVTVANAGEYFAYLVLYFNLRKRVQELLSCLTEEEKLDNKVYCMLMSEQFEIINRYNKNGIVYVQEKAMTHNYIKTFMVTYSIPYKVMTTDEEMANRELHTIGVMEFSPLFYLSPLVTKDDFVFYRNYSYCSAKSWRILCGEHSRNVSMMLFKLLFEEYIEDKSDDEIRRQMDTDYAKSYQTKKNIPAKHIEAMAASGFNQYFDYVELDEDCDLSKVPELEKEFRALATYLNWGKKEEVSLRFRRLGNHKASGLYYPALKCLCVDIRSPHSLAHEYFHMLDYENGEASRGHKFGKVLYKYREELEKYIASLPGTDPVREQFQGKTKYSKTYYFQPTEVFARCGEMYLVRHMRVDNSLVKPDGGFAYPKSDDLMKAIVEYYDSFLGLVEVHDDKILKVASN